MTKNTKQKQADMTQKQADLVREVIAEFGHTPEALFGPDGLIKHMTKRFVEQALDAEMEQHVGYPPHATEGRGSGNNRNGKSQKNLVTDSGTVEVQVPRDRNGSFEPKLVQKRQRRLEGFDEKVLYLYSQGLTTRDIQAQLLDMYGTEVIPTLISNITDRVLEDVRAFQSKPLESVYPVVYFDALVVKSRQEGRVQNRSVFVALGLNMEGQKEILGLWIAPTEGAKFWLSVFTEMKNRGMADCFIACVDGLKGLPEAIETVFPPFPLMKRPRYSCASCTRFVPP